MGVAELTNRIDHLAAEDDKLRKYSADELVEELTESMQKSDLGYTKSARSISRAMNESIGLY